MSRNKIFKRTLLGFKIAYMLYLLFAFNAFINGYAWMNLCSYVMTVWGGGMSLWMVIQAKRYGKVTGIWLLLAFVLSYVISAASHMQYGIAENFKGVVWLVLPILLLYVSAADKSGEEMRKELRILAVLYIIYTFIVNIISLTMIYWGRLFDYIDANGLVHGIGFRWGRLWGIYDDPNHGATITVIAVFLALYLGSVAVRKVYKVLAILTVFVNFVYIVFSDSRTGLLCMGIGMFTWLIMKYFDKEHRYTYKGIAGRVGAAVAVVGLILVGTYAIKRAYPPVDKYIVDVRKKAHRETPSQSAGRSDGASGGVTNGRFEIWKSGLQIVKNSPIIGVGYRNMTAYTNEYLPESYLVSNKLDVQYDSMHNLELDILVGQGLIGAIIFLLLIGDIVIALVRGIAHVPRTYWSEVCLVFTVSGILLVAGTFLSIIFYVNTPQGFWFWLGLGYLMRFCRMTAEKE